MLRRRRRNIVVASLISNMFARSKTHAAYFLYIIICDASACTRMFQLFPYIHILFNAKKTIAVCVFCTRRRAESKLYFVYIIIYSVLCVVIVYIYIHSDVVKHSNRIA